MGADLTARGLVQHRGGRQVLALDLHVAAGRRLGVLGPNGAGKSTLLRLLAGVDRPGAGTVRVGGQDPTVLQVRRRTALATQVPCLLSATARANVEAPLGWRGLGRVARRDRAEQALDRLGAGHLADRHARSLSGGEAQRVSLARAFGTAPDVLLLDEPCAGLDAPTRAGLLDALDAAVDGQTLVHVTHRPEEALRLADQVLVLVDGEVRQLAPPAILLAAPVDAQVALLIGYDAVVTLGGPVRRAGTPWGGTAAVTSAGVGLVPDPGGLPVVSVAQGAGVTVVGVALPGQGGDRPLLRAQLPAGQATPALGARVRVELDPRRSAVIGQPVSSADAFLTVG